MAVFTHKHCPVLRRIRVLVHRFGDLLPQPGVLGKPLTAQPADGVPAYLDGAMLPADIGLTGWNHVRFLSETEGVLEHELPLQQLVFSIAESLFSGQHVRCHLRRKFFARCLQETAHPTTR